MGPGSRHRWHLHQVLDIIFAMHCLTSQVALQAIRHGTVFCICRGPPHAKTASDTHAKLRIPGNGYRVLLLRTSGRGCRMQAAQGLRKQVLPDQARLVWELVHQRMTAHHSIGKHKVLVNIKPRF